MPHKIRLYFLCWLISLTQAQIPLRELEQWLDIGQLEHCTFLSTQRFQAVDQNFAKIAFKGNISQRISETELGNFGKSSSCIMATFIFGSETFMNDIWAFNEVRIGTRVAVVIAREEGLRQPEVARLCQIGARTVFYDPFTRKKFGKS